MKEDLSRAALQSLVEHACAFNNYEALKSYGISVRPDLVQTSRVSIRYQEGQFDCANDPEAIKSCLQKLLQL